MNLLHHLITRFYVYHDASHIREVFSYVIFDLMGYEMS